MLRYIRTLLACQCLLVVLPSAMGLAVDADAAAAACTCTGLDYTNGGSYLIDGSQTSNFAFMSVFSSCGIELDTCQPILVGPNGRQYACSAISMENEGTTQQSSCGIPYSDMPSGKWSIIIQADNTDFQVIREFNLTVVAASDRITTTVTPTVVVGVTSTAPGLTQTTTVTQTSLSVATPKTITAICSHNDAIEVTSYLPATKKTIFTTVEHTRIGGQTTLYDGTTTIIVATASCQGARVPAQPKPDKPAPVPAKPKPGNCGNRCRPWYGSGGWDWRNGGSGGGSSAGGGNGGGGNGRGSGGGTGRGGGAGGGGSWGGNNGGSRGGGGGGGDGNRGGGGGGGGNRGGGGGDNRGGGRGGGGGGRGRGGRLEDNDVVPDVKRDNVLRIAAVTTITVEASMTVAQTTTRVVPGRTAIETAFEEVIQTFTPPARTECKEVEPATITVFSTLPAQTVYEIKHVTRDTLPVGLLVADTEFDEKSVSAARVK
ncbi:hypothetical protein QBC35DRAFT_448567 [Podospora australis]|uniref:Uncharacterized protein n=1 Tax=Podospora australis TaxID=1536484 RepID=A0AAN6WZW3_9PEZI|nr:hypothetical protein QBC35DRAFT_448567 [Podospora australis]